MKLLHVISSVNPLGGGPMEAIRQMGVRLREMGHQSEVVCVDPPDAPHLSSFPLKVHALGPGVAGYQYNVALEPWLSQHAADYDAVIVDGLWQYHSFATWRAMRKLRRPYYVFTHGMLDPWFKHTYPLKHLKKWLYWPWAEYRVLRDAQAVLFTSEEERLLARKSFWLYRVRERVTAYGTSAPPSDGEGLRAKFLAQHPGLAGKRVLLYLSRIHEKKGCDLLVAAFAQLAQAHPDLHLMMAGPDQTGWVAKLQAQAQALGIADRISWPGMLQGDAKWGAYYSADAFVLPSHQENFGIVVAEALGCGLPVLISNKVNIWREIEAAGAGFVAADTLEGTLANLNHWLGLGADEQARMREQALALFADRFHVARMASSIVELVQEGRK